MKTGQVRPLLWTGGVVRKRPPGLIQHMLTVLVLGSWVLPLPQLPHSSWSLRLFLWASILLHGPLDICLALLPAAPYHPCKNRMHSTCFYNKGGHTPKYCFESTVSEERTHWVLRQTRWVLRETRWVRFGTQIIGRKQLTELAPRNSVSPKPPHWARCLKPYSPKPYSACFRTVEGNFPVCLVQPFSGGNLAYSKGL